MILTTPAIIAQTILIVDANEVVSVERGPTECADAVTVGGSPVAAVEQEAKQPEYEQVHQEATRLFWLLAQGLEVTATTGSAMSSGWAKFTPAQQTDGTEVVRLWRSVADQGFAEAQFALGFVTGSGFCVEQDHAEAMKWYQKAADQGHAEASFTLGLLHAEEGTKGLTPQNLAQANHCYQKAAKQGHLGAMFNLGIMHANGEGVEVSAAKAASWYRTAADQGHAQAQFCLGVKHEVGHGVKKDLVEAVRWYRMAAEKDQAYALFNLGAMHARGLGVQQDFVEAVTL